MTSRNVRVSAADMKVQQTIRMLVLSIRWQLCREDAQRAREEAAAKASKQMLEKFEEEWRPAVENLEQAALAFDDLEGARTPLHSTGPTPVLKSIMCCA